MNSLVKYAVQALAVVGGMQLFKEYNTKKNLKTAGVTNLTDTYDRLNRSR